MKLDGIKELIEAGEKMNIALKNSIEGFNEIIEQAIISAPDMDKSKVQEVKNISLRVFSNPTETKEELEIILKKYQDGYNSSKKGL